VHEVEFDDAIRHLGVEPAIDAGPVVRVEHVVAPEPVERRVLLAPRESESEN
jgi:hypothetical protein